MGECNSLKIVPYSSHYHHHCYTSTTTTQPVYVYLYLRRNTPGDFFSPLEKTARNLFKPLAQWTYEGLEERTEPDEEIK